MDGYSRDIQHEYNDFTEKVENEYETYGWDILGRQLYDLIDHYSKTGVVSLVAEDLRNMFRYPNTHDWDMYEPQKEGFIRKCNLCADKLIGIASSENEEFKKVITETKNTPFYDALMRGISGYVREEYEKLQFVIADNLVKNGYADEYLKAYAEQIEGGYIREVMNDDKLCVTDYDTKEELSHYRDYVEFYEALDKLTDDSKMASISKNDVGVKEPVKNIQKGKEQ